MKKEFKWEYDQEKQLPPSNEKGFDNDKGGSYAGYGSTGGYDNSFNKPHQEKETKSTSGWGSVRDARK